MSSKQRVKFLYRFLVRMGYLVAAQKLLQLLQHGFVVLGCNPDNQISSETLRKVITPHRYFFFGEMFSLH